MIFGSFLAAIFDLTYDTYGYTLIMINNICTALNAVYTKKKLEAKVSLFTLLLLRSTCCIAGSWSIWSTLL